MDETIEQLCTTLLKHELTLKALSAGTLRATASEVEAVRQKARRCESWLKLLGGRLALERVKSRAAAVQLGGVPSALARPTVVGASRLPQVAERPREMPVRQRLAV
ncbi:MAG: hypothetical protein HY749_20540 [Gammaproteobacteria bacterium]|nr:hypothetical protein [Gammaproteobacteria bacterium]